MEANRVRHRLIVAMLALVTAAVVLAAAAPARSTEDAELTWGRFETLSAGELRGFDVRGAALMVRAPAGGGTTVVLVRVRGLHAEYSTYPAHVHNAPCADGGGGHYQHEIGGAVDAVNEIWPTVSSNGAGRGRGFAVHGNWARPDAQSIVIHDPGDTSERLACADLR